MAQNNSQKIRPLWTLQDEEEDTFFQWWGNIAEYVKNDQRRIYQEDQRCLDFFQGMQRNKYELDRYPRDRRTVEKDNFVHVVVNRTKEIINDWVAKLTQHSSNVFTTPANSEEHSDRINAKTAKAVLDYVWYIEDVPDILRDCVLDKKKTGDSILFVDWNPFKGDKNPMLDEAEGELVPGGKLLTYINEFGEEAEKFTPATVGDIEYRRAERRNVIFQPFCDCIEKCDWVVEIERKDIDEIAALYEIEDEYGDFDENALTASEYGCEDIFDGAYYVASEQYDNCIYTYKLYHRGTTFMPDGAYIYFTKGRVLERSTLFDKVGHTDLPLAYLSDENVEGDIRSHSLLKSLMPLQIIRNNLESIKYTNQALGAHIFWLIPRQARVDISNIKNSASMVEYTGGIPPQLAQFKTVGGEIFSSIEQIDQSMDRVAAVHSISRGEVPTGVEAGVAMAFLEEKEDERAHPELKEFDRFTKKIAQLTLATAGAFYKQEDGRTLRIVGKNNAYDIQKLDVAKLSGPFDIRLVRDTGLVQSKSGRTAQLLSIKNIAPTAVPDAQFLDMLGLADDKRFTSVASVAVQRAEHENEMLFDGDLVGAPKSFEEHHVHWYTHVKFMQQSSYLDLTPEMIQQNFQIHVAAHEYFLLQLIASNPIFQQTFLTEYRTFPVILPPALLTQALQGGALPSLDQAVPTSAPPVEQSIEQQQVDQP